MLWDRPGLKAWVSSRPGQAQWAGCPREGAQTEQRDQSLIWSGGTLSNANQMQIETIMRYEVSPIRMAMKNNNDKNKQNKHTPQKIRSVSEDVEKLASSCSADGP